MFEETARRILLEVSGIVAQARGRYRLDQMLSDVEAVQDEMELQAAAAIPEKWRPK